MTYNGKYTSEQIDAIIDSLTGASEQYYTSRYSGEEIDNAIGRALLGGAIEVGAMVQHNDCPSGITLAELPNGFYRCIGGNYPWLPPGAPPWGTLRVWHYMDWYDADYGDIYGMSWALVPGGMASSWKLNATATPPQEFNLPFASSLVARNVINTNVPTPNTYRKNQFGEVSVCANYQRSGASDDIANGTLVTVLPSGYRPAKPIERESTVYYGGELHPAAGVIVNTDGTVLLYLTISVSYRYAKFELSFVAAQ